MCPRLTHLDLSGDLTEQAVKIIGESLSKLRYLRIEADRSRTVLTDRYFVAIGKLKELRELRVIFASGNNVSSEGIVDTLKKIPVLRKLELPFTSELGDQGALALAVGCPNLEMVDLYGCRNITDKGLLNLCSKLPHLRCLNVKRCSLLKPGILESLGHPGLQHMQIPTFSVLLSADVMMKLQNDGFSHEGSGRLFRQTARVFTNSAENTAGGILPHPTSGLYLRCETCRVVDAM